ncbi:type VII secretion target [Jongsikchunia kroppenstedtii]|uniref:type VII secretion target n=1 Tax=Jongsikchunia kroppenstedtii TaxID=1121721 RepID=UPI00037B29E0|nr:type VII secretion target [Jongsikchunia kroppenstedtii]
MNEVIAVPAAIEGFADAAAAMSVAVAGAGSVDAVAQVAQLAPVFGLIGQEYLAAYAAAQANHLLAVGQLAAVHAGTSAAAFASAARYRATDDSVGFSSPVTLA